MLSAPPGALCPLHVGNPATGVCERCGNFMCAACTPSGEPRCPTCREKETPGEFPFDASVNFTDLFNYIVEQFKRDPVMPIVGTIIFFGVTMAGSVVASIFSSIINTILGGDLNDPAILKGDPMVIARAFGVSQLVSLVVQSLTQAVSLTALYRLLIDILHGRKGDLGRMFSHLKELPKYLVLQMLLFFVNTVVPLLVFGGVTIAVLRAIDFDWSHPAATRPELLLTPVPLALMVGSVLALLVFSVVIMPLSIFAMPELLVGRCTPTEAISRAFALGSGQRLRMIGYGLIGGGIMLVGFIACCVGVIVAIPIVYMVWVGLFLALRKSSGLPPVDLT